MGILPTRYAASARARIPECVAASQSQFRVSLPLSVLILDASVSRMDVGAYVGDTSVDIQTVVLALTLIVIIVYTVKTAACASRRRSHG